MRARGHMKKRNEVKDIDTQDHLPNTLTKHLMVIS